MLKSMAGEGIDPNYSGEDVLLASQSVLKVDHYITH